MTGFDLGDQRGILGDTLEQCAALPDGSVDCVVTSPPYWGLRDYGADGQIGLEESPDVWVARLVAVFTECRRVLAPHGTFWLNIGDAYNANRGPSGSISGVADGVRGKASRGLSCDALKPKDLIGLPWMLAFALRTEGWWLRSEIIWSKPNPMPESVRDRPTKAHEQVFLLTRQPRYWYDAEAIRETSDPSQVSHNLRYAREYTAHTERAADTGQPGNVNNVGLHARQPADGRRNARSVWTVATQPYPEAHFATFPEELPRRCIAAGCPERVCTVCGQPSERITEVEYGKSPAHGEGSVTGRREASGQNNFDGAGMPRLAKHVTTVGWSDCGHDSWRAGVVLDPFLGSGTTLQVARRLNRHGIGIELNPDYLALAERRITAEPRPQGIQLAIEVQ